MTAIQRGIANTRWRDFVDIDHISRLRAIAEADLLQAMAAVGEHRQADLRPLAEVLADMVGTAQPKWLAWRRKQRLETTTAEQFQDLLDRCVAFADPVITGAATGSTWDPDSGTWG